MEKKEIIAHVYERLVEDHGDYGEKVFDAIEVAIETLESYIGSIERTTEMEGSVPIYRQFNIKKENPPNKYGCWCFSEMSAVDGCGVRNHWAIGTYPLAKIDIVKTLLKNIRHPKEYEVALKDSSLIKIEEIEMFSEYEKPLGRGEEEHEKINREEQVVGTPTSKTLATILDDLRL